MGSAIPDQTLPAQTLSHGSIKDIAGIPEILAYVANGYAQLDGPFSGQLLGGSGCEVASLLVGTHDLGNFVSVQIKPGAEGLAGRRPTLMCRKGGTPFQAFIGNIPSMVV